MRKPLPISIFAPSVLLAAALTACATYRGCGAAECTADQRINSEVEHLLDGYPALMGEIPIAVQTKNRIVYLNGLVATDLQRDTAETVALRAPGVAMVINGVAVTEK